MSTAALKHVLQVGIIVPDAQAALANFCRLFGLDESSINVQYGDYEQAIGALAAAGGRELVSGHLFGGHFCYWDLQSAIGLVLESSNALTDEYAQSILRS